MPLEFAEFLDVKQRIIGAHKAATWEEAKRKLRAVVALSGQALASEEGAARYERIRTTVEGFIAKFEADALDEP